MANDLERLVTADGPFHVHLSPTLRPSSFFSPFQPIHMAALERIVTSLNALFEVEALPIDPAFGRFVPMVYDPIGVDWRGRFEPDFTERFNGLMIRGAGDVGHVHCSSFPSDDVLDAFLAVASPGDLFFSHHPIHMECGDPRGAAGRGFLPIATARLDAFAERGLSFYACHAPMDYNRRIGTTLSMMEAIDGMPVADFWEYGNGFAGIVCDIPTTDGATLIARLEEIYGIPYADVEGKDRDTIDRVAVVAGCGDRASAMGEAERLGAQAYITGEIHCHIDDERGRNNREEVMEMVAGSAMTLIGVSHAASEHLVMRRRMAPWFREEMGVPASTIEAERWWR